MSKNIPLNFDQIRDVAQALAAAKYQIQSPIESHKHAAIDDINQAAELLKNALHDAGENVYVVTGQ